MKKNIQAVIEKGLCFGCGSCVNFCPQGAIEMVIDEEQGTYVPKIDKNKCKNCGACLESCPQNLQIDHNKEPDNALIGNYLNCYVGYAKDNSFRYNSSSGGMITSLLVFALEKKIISGALVVRMKKDKPLEPEPFIARSRKEIIEASGCKYCPVPVNIILKEILDSKPEEKFAIVGLPCHILGTKRAEEIKKELEQKIVLHFGLFCNHTPNFHGTKNLLEKFKIKQKQVIKLDYRCQGWPGQMRILKKQKETILPSSIYWNIIGSDLFTPKPCLACNEYTSELADISFGDAWLPEFKNDKIGRSIIISRSQQGQDILQMAKKEKIIELEPVSSKKVIFSQIAGLYLKKNEARKPMGLLKKKILLKLLKYVPLKIFLLSSKFSKIINYKKACYDFKKYIN